MTEDGAKVDVSLNLSERQEQVWRFIARYVDRHGYAPSIREIGEGVGLKSVNSVWLYLRGLEAWGYLECTRGRARSIVLLEWPEVM